MILTSHQPDFLPYTGVFAKMAAADVFEVRRDVQFVRDAYRHRVKMRGHWCTLPLQFKPKLTDLITDVELTEDWGFTVWDVVRGRYSDAAFWEERCEMVRVWLDRAAQSRLMWQANLELLLCVRDYLGIATPLVLSPPVAPLRGQEALQWLVEYVYEADDYLSGPGARVYLDVEKWRRMGRSGLQFMKHDAWTEDSILTTIFEKEHPDLWIGGTTERAW